MSCDEVLRLLREREATCHSEAQRLGVEAERFMDRPAMCEQEPGRISTACEVVGELPRIEPVPVSSTRSTAVAPDPAPEWTAAGHRGSGTSACGADPVCKSGVWSAISGGSWSGSGAPPDGSEPAPFGAGHCDEADGADSGRVVHCDAWHGRGERVNLRQDDGLLLVGRVDRAATAPPGCDRRGRVGAHARGAWARAAVGHHRRARGHLSGRVPLAGAEPARTRQLVSTPPSVVLTCDATA